MQTLKEFNEWFDNSEFAKLSDADVTKKLMQIAWGKGADCVKNNVLELLLMEGK